MSQLFTRRRFIQCGVSTAALAAGCATETVISPHVTFGSARLSARPQRNWVFRLAPGLHQRRIGTTDAVVYLPASALRRGLVPLLVFLHGASRSVLPYVEAHRAAAGEAGVAIVAPYSASDTWDGVYGDYDEDVASLDLVMQWVFYQLPVHPRAVVMTGFSDGAVYALAVGRANGAIFSRIAAYAPHRLLETDVQGLPPVLVSHGTDDTIVPWGVSAEQIVPVLREKGHEVEFVSFEGGHSVPQALMSAAVHDARARAH